MRCWVQSAPFLQRRSVEPLEPVWTAQRGCWLLARACSSSTPTSRTDKVSCTTACTPSAVFVLYVCLSDYFTVYPILPLVPPHVCSAVQQHRAGQCVPDPLQSSIPLPVHPVQLQNHLSLLALLDRCRQVGTLRSSMTTTAVLSQIHFFVSYCVQYHHYSSSSVTKAESRDVAASRGLFYLIVKFGLGLNKSVFVILK